MEYELEGLIYDTGEIIELVNGAQYVADQREFEFDAWAMYRAFYNQQPSYQHLIGTAQYDPKMTGKYDCCIDQMYSVLESKIWFDKKNNIGTVEYR